MNDKPKAEPTRHAPAAGAKPADVAKALLRPLADRSATPPQKPKAAIPHR